VAAAETKETVFACALAALFFIVASPSLPARADGFGLKVIAPGKTVGGSSRKNFLGGHHRRKSENRPAQGEGELSRGVRDHLGRAVRRQSGLGEGAATADEEDFGRLI